VDDKSAADRAKGLLSVLAVLSFSLILSYPILSRAYITGHDGDTHLHWIAQFIQSIQSGILVPSWVPYVNAGAGSTAFIFYPPFIFYVSFVIGLFTENVWAILNSLAVSGLALSGLTMYVLGRRFFPGHLAALCSILYMGLPYHLLQIYNRTAMAESWALAWLPLVFYFAEKPRNLFCATGLVITFALLIITHPPTALIAVPFVMAFFLLLFSKEKDLKLLMLRAASLLLSVGLTSRYTLPVLFEEKFISLKITMEAIYDYKGHFIFAEAGSNFNTLAGWAAVAAIPVICAVLIIFFFAMREKEEPVPGFPLYAGFSGLAAVFMMFSFSDPVWRLFPMLQKILFPWRFNSLVMFFSSLCAGFGYLHIRNSGMGSSLKLAFSGGLTIVLVVNAMLSLDVLRRFKGMPFELVEDTPELEMRTDFSYKRTKR
jgi:uncharacterized membrane protein